MPYSSEHKKRIRANIVESARVLFNRHGFDGVTIDMVMKSAGLTRGGFYNHFDSKEMLYQNAVESFLMCRGAQWRAEVGVDPNRPSLEMARQMVQGYLSNAHLGDLDGQCPMIALPSDVARASSQVQSSYQHLLEAMVSIFETSLANNCENPRQKALSLAALCVGGMVLAKALPDSVLAEEVRAAAHAAADESIGR